MGIKYICDRCGGEEKKTDDSFPLYVRSTNWIENSPSKELCKDCAVEWDAIYERGRKELEQRLAHFVSNQRKP